MRICRVLKIFLNALILFLTYSMKQSSSWEANQSLQLVEKVPRIFIEPEISSPYSQAPATRPYPDTTPFSPHNPLQLPEDPS
jgi:hypothetical protein